VGDTRLQDAVDTFEKTGAEVSVKYKPYMIDPRTNQQGENKQDYCRRRGWGGGWKPGPLREWQWWPNTMNAHRVCTYLEQLDAQNQNLSQREKDQRGLDLIKKYYDLTYERDFNISTPEGAAQAMEELGFAKASDVVEWLNRGGGQNEVARADTHAKRDMDIHGVPHFVVTGPSGSPMELHGAQDSRAFLSAFSRVAP
jgi:predicted DsbA family dithiol-disulfide isomerase